MSQFNIIVSFVEVVSLGIFCSPNSFPFYPVGQIDYLYLIQLDLLWKQEVSRSAEVLWCLMEKSSLQRAYEKEQM